MLNKAKQHGINIANYPHMSHYIMSEWKELDTYLSLTTAFVIGMKNRYSATITELEQLIDQRENQSKPANEIRAKIEIYRTFINDLENLL